MLGRDGVDGGGHDVGGGLGLDLGSFGGLGGLGGGKGGGRGFNSTVCSKGIRSKRTVKARTASFPGPRGPPQDAGGHQGLGGQRGQPGGGLPVLDAGKL